MIYFKFLIIILVFPTLISPDRILGVFPIPSISHQVVFRAYVKELAKHGHEVIVMTPSPNDKPTPNVTEIDVSDAYKSFNSLFVDKKYKRNLKRGVITDMTKSDTDKLIIVALDILKKEFDHPLMQKLIRGENKKIDLIVAESLINYPLGLAYKLNVPVIQISSFYGTPENYEAFGAPCRHPMLYPSPNRSKFGTSLFNKLRAIHQEWMLKRNVQALFEHEEKLMRKTFGQNMPPLSEIRKKVDLLFLNSHPIFDGNRPVPPNVVYLGAIHMSPVQNLPADLKEYLDNSKSGVIYVSLGTNVRPKEMDKDLLDAFIDAFEELPYDILWKFDGDNVENIPTNVKIYKWFPQRDLLHHKNIKLFVMQGGVQSTDEAIDAGVPLVGIPFLGDQWYNVRKQVELGIGVEVDAETLTKENLVDAVFKVIGDKRYKDNILKLRAIINDQPNTALERAVWWTEYVLRHGGARHLRAPSANISWAEYLMLDVVIPVIVISLILIIFILATSYYIFRKIPSRFNISRKLKNN